MCDDRFLVNIVRVVIFRYVMMVNLFVINGRLNLRDIFCFIGDRLSGGLDNDNIFCNSEDRYRRVAVKLYNLFSLRKQAITELIGCDVVVL